MIEIDELGSSVEFFKFKVRSNEVTTAGINVVGVNSTSCAPTCETVLNK